jgi:hypothetical protein
LVQNASIVGRTKALSLFYLLTLPRKLGSEVVKIVCGEQPLSDTWLGKVLPTTFTVHKSLLRHHSRFFREKLQMSFDKEILAHALVEIEFEQAENSINGEKSTYFSYEDAPAGYIPSWLTSFEGYQRQAQERSPPAAMSPAAMAEKQIEETVELLDEQKHKFGVFVHWLYTQELVLDDEGFPENPEAVCAQIYGLAERLDVPALRQQCYNRLRKYYTENDELPGEEVVEVIIKECRSTSLLRKYMVASIAHEVIMSGSQSKEFCDPILALDKDFAAEVAMEIMDRLRCNDRSKDPNEEEKFEGDDSDSDVNSSEDIGSDMAYDSDGYMSISDGEDVDSLYGDGRDKTAVAVDGSNSDSSLSTPGSTPSGDSDANEDSDPDEDSDANEDSDLDASMPASGAPTTSERATKVKTEAGSSADRTLMDANANKRKRPSSAHSDGGKNRAKRHGRHAENEIEILDLTAFTSD